MTVTRITGLSTMERRVGIRSLLLLVNIGIAFGIRNKTVSLVKRSSSQKYDAASFQLARWAKANPTINRATEENGVPVSSLTASLGIGTRGPLLLQDLNFHNHVASFAQERIPERVVHTKGPGALGYFVVTHKEITKYSRAKLFSKVGKRTPIAIRFSTDFRESGSADTENEVRGFAVKFYTDDGNWDFVGLSTIVFALRDPILFPSFVRSRKRNPETHLIDYNMFWDFTAKRPETTFQTMLMFSDVGFPANYRHINGSSVNTFRLTGGTGGETVFVRFLLVSNQGKKIMSPETYARLAGTDPDYFFRDLYNAIQNKNPPSWTVNIQVMTQKQSKEFKYNPFDPTKMLPIKDFPLIPVGKVVVNQNVNDYFTLVEMAAYNPGAVVPGIEPGPDRVLHGRIFTYAVSHRHRLNKNMQQYAGNEVFNVSKVHTYTRDGEGSVFANGKGDPNYYPNSYNGPEPMASGRQTPFYVDGGTADRVETGEEFNHEQVADYWETEMTVGERKRTILALAAHLAKASPQIQEQSLKANWDPISEEFSRELRAALVAANARRAIKTKVRVKVLGRKKKELNGTVLE